MYNSKLAVALKSNGKVLREFGENVYIPFGSEYSIFIKNLNTVRALVSIEIDGDDVADGEQFVIEPNSSLDLERFMRRGNKKKGNRFKFVERTGALEEAQGIGIEDGIVRVEFAFERKPDPIRWNDTNIWTRYGGSAHHDIIRGASATYTCSTQPVATNASLDVASVNFTSTDMDAISPEVANDAGVTVEGSISEQEFRTASWFPTESTTHAIVLKMLGETDDNKQVRKPVTVKSKVKCSRCGTKNKATAKFCAECGTSLTIV